MKKLLMITLSLLLFTILISPVQAKRPGPLDRPLPDYNNLTLRQIFEDGPMTLTYSSSENINNITVFMGGKTGTHYVYSYGLFSWNVNIYTTNKYYLRMNIDNTISGTRYTWWRDNTNIDSMSNQMGSGLGYLEASFIVEPILKNYSRISAIWHPSTIGNVVSSDKPYLLDLTTLGIPTATKIEMDNLYLDYLKYKNMMNATDVMLIVGQLGAFVWSLVVSFEIFGFVLWEYALFGIGAGFIGYLALKIIQKKAGDDNGDSD